MITDGEIKFHINGFHEVLANYSYITIFGAGPWGQYIAKKIINMGKNYDIIFCDNNPDIQNSRINGIEVIPVEKAVQKRDTGFIVSFYKNNLAKLESVYFQLIKNRVRKSQIYIIAMNDILETKEEDSLLNTENYIKELIHESNKKETIKTIKTVKSLVYREKPPKDLINGPSGVMNLQEQALGNQMEDITLEYIYKDGNDLFNPENRQGYITNAIDFARRFYNDKNTIYIVHDIFSAFGLYTIGKHYIVIYHNQGTIECEAENMGEDISEKEKKLINHIEKIAIKNAFRVYFPSDGARKWFYQTLREENEYPYYQPLYNTMVWHVRSKKIEGLDKLEDTVTFFGTGQLTCAKGMDRIPEFISKLISGTNKKIRLIIVGTGPCKKQINEDMNKITKTHSNITYFQFDHLEHSQIKYILSISDIYLMLHRISIFDIATLEAMEAGLEIILSNIPGNTDFNKENNIILVDHDEKHINLNEIITMREEYGKRNKEVFYKYFSVENFKQRYIDIIKECIKCLV